MVRFIRKYSVVLCVGIVLFLGASLAYAENTTSVFDPNSSFSSDSSTVCDVTSTAADTCPTEEALVEEELVELEIVAEAQKYIGTRYRFGGTTPSGFDCSGFVRWVYQQFDVSLPRTAREQAKIGEEVSPDELKIGDILVFRSGRTGYHSGIYVGNDRFIHSPSTGKSIRETSLKVGYFANRLITARRLLWGPSR